MRVHRNDTGNRCFGDVKLTVSHFRVRINERLLINTPDTFQVTYIERVLRTQSYGKSNRTEPRNISVPEMHKNTVHMFLKRGNSS